ncbi:MAG: hypothetical protein ABSC94_27890 [Polyangiaceae bacterium]
MRPLPAFPNTSVANVDQWDNFHHTITGAAVPGYLTPGEDGVAVGATLASVQTSALNAILAYCFTDPVERLCTIGARWSLSNILSPANLILDPGIWDQMMRADPTWSTPAYVARAQPKGGVPIIVQGGTNVRAMNNWLGKFKLALQTSGASDGHRIAGCIATGTHGSDLKVGAVHDTILAVYLVTGPNLGVLVQPATRWFSPAMAAWFQSQTTIPTQDLADDDLFNAAIVGLGGLGFVHSVVVETVPIYQLSGQTVARTLDDAAIWNAIDTLDTTALVPTPNPDFFTVVFSPYAPNGSTGAYATVLWKKPPTVPWTAPAPVPSATSTDLARLLSALIPKIDSSIDERLIGDIVADVTGTQYKAGTVAPTFPGTYFGPTTLPEGDGRSSEVIVDHANARAAISTVIQALQSEAQHGRHLLGGIGVRFVPKTTALLGPNQAAMNTYIEFPSLDSTETSAIHTAVWNALRTARIPFTCHWGQEYGMDASSIRAFFGNNVGRWMAARARLLPTPAARAVFTNPLLAQLDLG